MPHLLFSSKDDLNKSFCENIHFGGVVVWYIVSQMIVHFFKASIQPSSLYSIHPFLQNYPGGKYLVRQGIESNSSDKLCLFFCLYPSYTIYSMLDQDKV